MPSLTPRWFPFLATGPLCLVAATAQVAIQRQAPRPVAAKADPQPVLAIGTVAAPRATLAKVDPDTAAAIQRGIDWLLAHQDDDGRWDADEFVRHDEDAPTGGPGNAVHDVAVTGLALLALAREGTAARSDPRHDPLLRGAHWLALQQQENGILGTNTAHDFVYGHAIATLGLWATAAATGSAEARDAAANGVKYLSSHRNPYGVWRYQPRDNDNDTSVTTWAAMACLAGRELGEPIDAESLQNTSTWFRLVTDAAGRAGYTRAGEPSSRDVRNASLFPPSTGEAMTAAAVWCRQCLGDTPAKEPQLVAGRDLLAKKPPEWKPAEGKVDYCYWFFGSEAMRRLGGEGAAQWQRAVAAALLQGQRKDGTAAGSWDPVDPWGDIGGRLYATAMAVLALQARYDVPALAPKPAEPK